MLGLGSKFHNANAQHPVLGPAIARARKGDVRSLLGVFSSSENDPSVRHAAVGACVDSYFANSDQAASLYDAWLAHSPNDVFGHLARAKSQLARVPSYDPDEPDATAKARQGDDLRAAANEDLAIAKRLAPGD